MKKRNIKYIILAIVAFCVAAYVVFAYNKPAEKTNARIDITTALVNAQKPQFEIYIDNSETPEKQSDWMPNFKIQGYVVQKNSGVKDIKIKALKNADINVNLRGEFEKDEKGEPIKHWVKYTSMTVNGQEVLLKPVDVWHNEPFVYTINAKAGDSYDIHVEWKKSSK